MPRRIAIPNANYLAVLAPYDLTRGGSFYNFFGHADMKELALFIEDQIKAGNWLFNLGLREDVYNGLTDANQTQPRVGIAYNVKPSATVLRISYARTLETPFNENLVLSSKGCANAVLAPLLNCSSGRFGNYASRLPQRVSCRISAGASARGSWSAASISGSTRTTPSTSACWATRPSPSPSTGTTRRFPATRCMWRFRRSITSAPIWLRLLWRRASIRRRWPEPELRWAQTGLPFRIDHDEKFNQTTHLQYTIPGGKFVKGMWGGFNWRYDTAQWPDRRLAIVRPMQTPPARTLQSRCRVMCLEWRWWTITFSATTNPVTLQPVYIPLTLDQEFQGGFACNGVAANVNDPSTYFATCPAIELTSKLIDIPAPGKGDNDHDPPRIQHRDLFDASLGKDNIFHGSRYKMNLDLTAINITNKYALYNFLSTFSGTHYVTPRAMTAKITLNF